MTLKNGTTIGHYEIREPIGAGGMGEVYAAHDTSLDRSVAVKVLPSDLVQDAERVERFRREARAASGLSHPHIVAIHEIGEADVQGPEGKFHFIAMELVDGTTLRDRIRDTTTPRKDLLRWLAQTADALAKAHAAGIVHRDLKPENVMVSKDGYAKVLDFGLAKLVETAVVGGNDTNALTIDAARGAAAAMTAEGVVLGTVGYMSPEQVRAEGIDHRADIFSFGCLLYESVTGRQPFTAETPIDVMHRILRDPPAAIRDLAPDAPTVLRRMIHRCLEKGRERRYQSMKDLALELADLVEDYDEIVRSSPQGADCQMSQSEISGLSMHRKKGIGASVVLAVVFGLAGWICARILAPPALDPRAADIGEMASLRFSQLTLGSVREYGADISPDGSLVAYVKRSQAWGWTGGEIFVQRVGGSQAIRLTEGEGKDDFPAFSPDGTQIAFVSPAENRGGLFVMGATGESRRRLTDFGYSPDWSPNGRYLVFDTVPTISPYITIGNGRLWILDLETDELREIPGTDDAFQPRWSPGGRRIAYMVVSSGQRNIRTVPAAGDPAAGATPDGKPVAVTHDDTTEWNPVWSPDGHYLYFSSDRSGSLNLWRAPIDEITGEVLGEPEPFTLPNRSIGRIDFSADGETFVFEGQDKRSTIMAIEIDLARMEVVGAPRAVIPTTRRFQQPRVSPDGEWVVFRSQFPEDLYLVRPDGSEARQLTDDGARDRRPTWTSDSKIVFASNRGGGFYQIWQIDADGGDLRQVTRFSSDANLPLPSPDGSAMIVSAFGEPRKLVDLTRPWPITEGDALPPTKEKELFHPLAWTPDSERIVGAIGEPFTPTAIVVYTPSTETYDWICDLHPEMRSWLTAAFISDGRRLIFGHRSGIAVLDVTTGELRRIAGAPIPSGLHVTLSSDDRFVYYDDVRSESDIWLGRHSE